MSEEYYKGKPAEFASILDWAKRPIAFISGKEIIHSMREEGAYPPREVWGVSAEFFQDTGKHTCVHVEKPLYDYCESPYKDDPNYWLAHELAGDPHVYSHDADEEDDG